MKYKAKNGLTKCWNRWKNIDTTTTDTEIMRKTTPALEVLVEEVLVAEAGSILYFFYSSYIKLPLKIVYRPFRQLGLESV